MYMAEARYAIEYEANLVSSSYRSLKAGENVGARAEGRAKRARKTGSARMKT